MKKPKFSKVTAVKSAAREHIGMPPVTKRIPNKKRRKLEHMGDAMLLRKLVLEEEC